MYNMNIYKSAYLNIEKTDQFIVTPEFFYWIYSKSKEDL